MAKQAHTRRMTGVTNYQDHTDETVMASAEELTIERNQVTLRIAELGTETLGRIVESSHPAVIRHTNRVVAARKAHEHHLRRINAEPIPKPAKSRQRLTWCPTCNGSGEEDTGVRIYSPCRQCGGARKVPAP